MMIDQKILVYLIWDKPISCNIFICPQLYHQNQATKVNLQWFWNDRPIIRQIMNTLRVWVPNGDCPIGQVQNPSTSSVIPRVVLAASRICASSPASGGKTSQKSPSESLVGGPGPPRPEIYEWQSIGMMIEIQYFWENKKWQPVTTNQSSSDSSRDPSSTKSFCRDSAWFQAAMLGISSKTSPWWTRRWRIQCGAPKR